MTREHNGWQINPGPVGSGQYWVSPPATVPLGPALIPGPLSKVRRWIDGATRQLARYR